MKILNGKKIAVKILKNLKKEIRKRRLKLRLAVILIKKDRFSESFVKQIKKSCQSIGIDFKLFKFGRSDNSFPSGLNFKEKIKKIAKDPNNSGVVIVAGEDFSSFIPSKKNTEKISSVVSAVERILKNYRISLQGKKIALVGRGRLVGQPIAKWLRKQGIKFLNIDKDLFLKKGQLFKADIIISGAGKKNLITGEMVKKGAVVIDIGADIDFKSVSQKTSYITPIPGGVGPVTVACLLQNLVKISKNKN